MSLIRLKSCIRTVGGDRQFKAKIKRDVEKANR